MNKGYILFAVLLFASGSSVLAMDAAAQQSTNNAIEWLADRLARTPYVDAETGVCYQNAFLARSVRLAYNGSEEVHNHMNHQRGYITDRYIVRPQPDGFGGALLGGILMQFAGVADANNNDNLANELRRIHGLLA